MKEKLYNTIICILSLVSVLIAIIDFTKGLNQILFWTDTIIYILFIIDYITRFFLADKKKVFIKTNIFDLIAIIPFNSAFRIFRILKFSKILRFTKIFRVASLSARSMSKIKKFLNTNGFKYVLFLTGGAILISSLAMTYFENMNFQDSLWWSFVTATTVGYGDLSPTTIEGRIIASLLMIVGIGLIGSMTSSITSYFLNKEVKQPVNSDKIEMVITLYEKLTTEEKETFKKAISRDIDSLTD